MRHVCARVSARGIAILERKSKESASLPTAGPAGACRDCRRHATRPSVAFARANGTAGGKGRRALPPRAECVCRRSTGAMFLRRALPHWGRVRPKEHAGRPHALPHTARKGMAPDARHPDNGPLRPTLFDNRRREFSLRTSDPEGMPSALQAMARWKRPASDERCDRPGNGAILRPLVYTRGSLARGIAGGRGGARHPNLDLAPVQDNALFRTSEYISADI
jgi:hypothetical protein